MYQAFSMGLTDSREEDHSQAISAAKVRFGPVL